MNATFLPPELERDGAMQLWRYMKLSAFLLLLEGTAFFPSVATLRSSDPLEGDLHPEPEWLSTKLEDICGSELGKLEAWLHCKATKAERTLQEANRCDPHFYSQFIADLYVRELAKRRAVWCWFASSSESAGMWSNYGHGGIAVRTTIAGLREALPDTHASQIAQIHYAGRCPNAPDRFDPESRDAAPRIHRPHLIKGAEYKSEREVRVVTACNGDEKCVLIRGINVDRLIQEVVISPLLPSEEAGAIKRLLGTKLEVRRSSLLGERRIARDETRSAINERFGDKANERDLPPLIASL